MYREGIDEIALHVERETDRTPDDGRYHVLLENEVIGSFQYLRDAQAYLQLKAAKLGWRPERKTVEERIHEEQVNRYYVDTYRDKRSSATRKGGRGGRGGV